MAAPPLLPPQGMSAEAARITNQEDATRAHSCVPKKDIPSMRNQSTAETRKKHHFIRLSGQLRTDANWWWIFAAPWNGVAVLLPSASKFVESTSDVAGVWGCGAWYQSNGCSCSGPKDRHIPIKELRAALLPVAAWGHFWRGRNVCGLCDYMAAVQVVAPPLHAPRSLPLLP